MKKTIIAKIEIEAELNYELTTYDVELALRKYFPQGRFTVKEKQHSVQFGEVHDLHKDDLDRIKELEAELKVNDKLLEDRLKILEAIPSCVAHGGQCVPHALEWIEQVKTLARVVSSG